MGRVCRSFPLVRLQCRQGVFRGIAVKGGHTRGMAEIDNKPQDDHRERREVEPIGLVVLANLRSAVKSKVKSETYEEENAYDADQTQSS